MSKSILDNYQTALLKDLSSIETIADSFYLSGGTALAEFYLHHRLSEDLDFFTTQEFDAQSVYISLKALQKRHKIKQIDFQKSFNRNLFFLHYEDGYVLKTEFTYYPFTQLEQGKVWNGIKVDSLMDIATNKAFTIYQNPRTRDFIDLYMILADNSQWTFNGVLRKARLKFDWHIDPIQLGAQIQKVKEVKDYPKMITRIEDSSWQNFFLQETQKLADTIFQ